MSSTFSALLRTKLKDLESSLVSSHECILHDVSVEVAARVAAGTQDAPPISGFPGSLSCLPGGECQAQKSGLRAILQDASRTVDDKAFSGRATPNGWSDNKPDVSSNISQDEPRKLETLHRHCAFAAGVSSPNSPRPLSEPNSPKLVKLPSDAFPAPPALTEAAATPLEPPPCMPVEMHLPAGKQSASAPSSARTSLNVQYLEPCSNPIPKTGHLRLSSPLTTPRCSNVVNFDTCEEETGGDDESEDNISLPGRRPSEHSHGKQQTGRLTTQSARSSVASWKCARIDADDDFDGTESHPMGHNLSGVNRVISLNSRKGLQAGCTRFLNSHAEMNEVEVLPVWQGSRELVQGLKDGTCRIERNMRRTLTMESGESAARWELSQRRKSRLARLVVMPNSSKRISWDLLGLIFITYDAVFIPLAFFDPAEMTSVSVMNWAARLFWTCDLPTSFLTGFLTADGQVEMRPGKIFWHYSRTWLCPDMLVIWFDWMEVLFNTVGNAATVGQTSRAMRLIRLLRMLRLAKLPELLASMGERIRSEEVILVVNMLKVTVSILGSAHVIACIWYGIGSQRDTNSSWVWYYGYSDRDLIERYTMSFHWSLMSFAGGTQDVRSRNNSERTFEVVVAFLCFAGSAAFVSSLTSSLTRLQIISGSKSARFMALRKYLSNRGISRKLMARVQRNAQHVLLEKQRHLPESEVDLLQIISEPLRVELHFEEHCPTFRVHPFFVWYADKNPAGMRKLCHSAVTHKTLSSGDVLFTDSEIPADPHMHIVLSGLLEYSEEHHGKGSRELERQVVETGRCISEVVLWIPWVHQGNLRATAECRLICLSAHVFHEVAEQFASPDCHPGLYAVEFCDSLKADKEDGVLPNDLVRLNMPFEVMSKVTDLQNNNYGVSRNSGNSEGTSGGFKPLTTLTRRGTKGNLGTGLASLATNVRRWTNTAAQIGQALPYLRRNRTLENISEEDGPPKAKIRQSRSGGVAGFLDPDAESVMPKECLQRSATAG